MRLQENKKVRREGRSYQLVVRVNSRTYADNLRGEWKYLRIEQPVNWNVVPEKWPIPPDYKPIHNKMLKKACKLFLLEHWPAFRRFHGVPDEAFKN